MQTSIQQVNPAEYELEIKASAEDLAPEIDKALRAQRIRTNLKGFRPGKVPLNLVKKLYGKAVAYGVAEQSIQTTYESEVLNKEDYEVLGQPVISKLDYEMDGDLHAVVRFGVRPEIELKDISSEQITKLVHTVTDEDVDKEIEHLREREAELIPVEGAAEEDNLLVVDIQRLDDATGTPIIGQRDENVSVYLSDNRVNETLRDALLGKQSGDVFRVDIPHEHPHEHDEHLHSDLIELPAPPGEDIDHPHTHAYQVTVKEIKRRELPELNAEFIKEVSQGRFEDMEAFRQDLRGRIERVYKRHTQDVLSEQIIAKMLELHPIPVPESVTNSFLDTFVQDVKQRNKGTLPGDFDEASFREENREEAERQARWMLIRDQFIKKEDLKITDEDRDRYFNDSASADLAGGELRRFYESVPSLLEQLDGQLLANKVIDVLAQKFQVVEKEISEAGDQEFEESLDDHLVEEEISSALEEEPEQTDETAEENK